MGSGWKHSAVGSQTGAPLPAGKLAGYAWERDATQHIVFHTADGRICELWQRQGQPWKLNNLSASLSNAPTAEGDLGCYAWESDGTQHIVYRAKNGQVNELWCKQGKSWEYGGALSSMASAPAAAGTPCGYAWEKDSTQHIVYRGTDGHIHELWQRQGQPWKHGGALTQVAGAPEAAGDPVGYAWEADGTQHVVYVGKDHHVHELWQRQGQKWQHSQLSGKGSGSPSVTGDDVSCMAFESDRTQHIFYVGADHHIHEIWFKQGESWKDGGALSSKAGGPTAAGSACGYAWEKGGTQHVLYRGADNQVHELWFRGGEGWKHGQALSQEAGAPRAFGDPVGYAWENDGTQHVIYIAEDKSIHELWQRA